MASNSGYVDPIPKGAIPERIDQGVDFSGSGPILAIGDAQIIETGGTGWPGGPFMSYKLTSGPDSGDVVYVAENIRPSVRAGQHVKAGQQIATMFSGGTGIETGWADAAGTSPESQTSAAGSISGANLPPGGTKIGHDFENLLTSLGAPAAPNNNQPGGGTNPSGFSTGTPSSGGSGSGGFGFDFGPLIGPFKDIDAFIKGLIWFTHPQNMLRIVAGIFAFFILAAGVSTLVSAGK